MRRLAHPLGATRIGSNVTSVPPGKAAFPAHHHFANEEHFFVLAGTGVLRNGDEWYEVGPQDYIYCAPGSSEHAHQLINTGNVDLVYLAISTLQVPEVVGYPDSHKTGVAVAPFGQLPPRFLVEDKLKALQATGAERVVSADCGCLMNILGHAAWKDQQEGRTKPSLPGEHIATFLLRRTDKENAQ